MGAGEIGGQGRLTRCCANKHCCVSGGGKDVHAHPLPIGDRPHSLPYSRLRICHIGLVFRFPCGYFSDDVLQN